jgi:hypothetical protein
VEEEMGAGQFLVACGEYQFEVRLHGVRFAHVGKEGLGTAPNCHLLVLEAFEANVYLPVFHLLSSLLDELRLFLEGLPAFDFIYTLLS